MRLKTITALSMKEAMKLVREELGDDAIIVATRRGPNGKGIRLTAAVEQLDPPVTETPFAITDGEKGLATNKPGQNGPSLPPKELAELLTRTLKNHGTPGRVIERLVHTANVLSLGDPVMALAAVLDEGFRFSPLFETTPKRPMIFVGPPGAGKTVSVAKLATRAVLNKTAVEVLTADTVRAGGAEQLAAFMRILKLDLKIIDEGTNLKEETSRIPSGVPTLIDSAGINPFDERETEELAEIIEDAGAEPILVLSAGGDAVESAEIAEIFAGLGASRMLITRLDLSRRLGSLLAAADAGRLRFSEVSITPNVGEGLSPINPVSLARLLLPPSQVKSEPFDVSDLNISEAAV